MAFHIPNEADAGNSNQAEPDSVDFAILAAAMQGSAVVVGCAVTDNASGLQVDVAAGAIIVNGTPVVVAPATVAAGTADGTNPRFDLVVVNSSGTVSVQAGTAAANPVFPAIPANSVVLASLYVAASVTTLATADITDKRFIVGWRALDQGRIVGWITGGQPGSPFNVRVLAYTHNSAGTRNVSNIGSGPAQGNSFDTGSTISTRAGEHGSENVLGSAQGRVFYESTFKLNQTTDIRFYSGLAQLGTGTDSNDPIAAGPATRHYAGLQYSTPRSDTAFQYISNDNAGQEITTSGVSVDTAWHTFRVLVDVSSGDILFELDGANHVVHTGSLPTTVLLPYSDMYNQAAASKTFVRGHIKTTFGVHP